MKKRISLLRTIAAAAVLVGGGLGLVGPVDIAEAEPRSTMAETGYWPLTEAQLRTLEDPNAVDPAIVEEMARESARAQQQALGVRFAAQLRNTERAADCSQYFPMMHLSVCGPIRDWLNSIWGEIRVCGDSVIVPYVSAIESGGGFDLELRRYGLEDSKLLQSVSFTELPPSWQNAPVVIPSCDMQSLIVVESAFSRLKAE